MIAKNPKNERLKVLSEIDALLKLCKCNTHDKESSGCKYCESAKGLGFKLLTLSNKKPNAKPTRPNFKWTDEVIEQLRIDSKTQTYKEIATKLGVTKNSLYMKCLGLGIKCVSERKKGTKKIG